MGNQSYILFLVLGIFIHLPVVEAQCPPGAIQFTTQQQIIEFALRYPHCSEINGNLTIGLPYGVTDITDLSPLQQIRHINGYLNVVNNPHLKSLSGLNQLERTEGYLNVFNNDQLKNIDALQSLTHIGGSLWILHNDQLTSVGGLQNLTGINGSLDISSNPSLRTFDGLGRVNPIPTLDYTLAKINAIRIVHNGVSFDVDSAPSLMSHFEIDPVQLFQSFAGKPYHTRAINTDRLYLYVEHLSNPQNAAPILDQILEIGKRSGDAHLKWEALLLHQYFNLKHGEDSVENKIQKLKDFSLQAGKNDQLIIQARAIKFIAFTFWEHYPDYEKLFKTYHELEELISHLNPSEFPDMAQCYMIIGRAHYFFRDYREAMHYFRKAVALPQIPFNTTFIMHSQNNIGLCYQKLNLLDSSDLYFRQILEDPNEYPVEIWKGIASGNLGYNHYLRKEFEQAIPLLERDYLTGESIDDWGLAAGSLIPLADIYIKKNELEKAEQAILKARQYIWRSGQTDRLRLLYPVITKWHSAMGHKELAADYVDSTKMAVRDYNDKFNALKLLRARQELNANELRLREVQKQRLIQQRNTVIGILTLSFLFGVVFLFHRNQNQKRKQEIRELRLKNTEESLNHARTKLQSLTQKIRENNQIIDRLQENYSTHTDFKMIRELQNATILTSEDWEQFKSNFQQTYPGFIEILESRYPDLTHSEVRCLCLQKLRMSNREIAAALGVSPKSINVTNHRIRKKLNLDNQEMLNDLVQNIV